MGNIFNLFDPSIPAEDKLLSAHAPISRHIEDHKQIIDHGGIHSREKFEYLFRKLVSSEYTLVGFSFLISEESFADCSEFIDIDGVVSERILSNCPSNDLTYSSLSNAAKQASILSIFSSQNLFSSDFIP